MALQAVLCAILDTGNELLLLQLCERDIDINQSTYAISSNATLLHNAVDLGHWNVFDLLLASGADVNKLDDFGRSPLLLAARNGHRDIAKKLLGRTKDINTQDIGGNTALSEAVFHGRFQILERLLDAGAQVAPQEPGPHSKLVLESARTSGYAHDAILDLIHGLPGIPTASQRSAAKIMDSMLRAEIKMSRQSALRTTLDNVTFSVHRIGTCKKALKVLKDQGLNEAITWYSAQAAPTPEMLPAIEKARAMAEERALRHMDDLEKSWVSKPPHSFSLHLHGPHPNH
ncbi:hypothetical protein IMSHALPRED_002230 [Imshaugia aleurites]|uniref:Ankyrin repeat protein n=1 Tax=Imshaugia aleurites TaxID=172621 RepID=A0A8H3PID9_9LECA|nr:hypothetical protein IMSHALPRED_002230 [Imshaugia aleurites]